MLEVDKFSKKESKEFRDSLEKISSDSAHTKKMKQTDFLGALKRYENLLERIKKLDHDKLDGKYKLAYREILIQLSNINYYSAKYDKAKHYTDLLAQAAEFYNDKKMRAMSRLQYGNIFADLSDFSAAMKYSTEALKLYTELNDIGGMGSANNNIANIFVFQYKESEAYPYYEKALGYFNQIENEELNKSNVLQNLASIHIKKGEFSRALDFLDEATKLKEQMNDSFGTALSKFLMGELSVDMKDYESAIANYKSALEIQEKLDDKNGILFSNMHLGNAYIQKFLFESKKEKSLLARAEKHLLEALFTAQKINSKYNLSLIYNTLYELHETQGDFEKALEYHVKFYEAEKEIFNEKVSLEVQKLEKEFQLKEAKHTAEMNQLRNVELAETVKKLEETVKQKNEFLGIVVHDLKNPIGNIKLLAEFLIDEGSYSKNEITEFKKYIIESAETSLDLVTQLLDYAAIEQGKIILNISDFDIAAETERIIRLYKLKTMQKEIEVKYRNELKSNIVKTDKNSIVQILDNLFSNAIKFSPPNKSIMLRLSETDRILKIEIKDEGPGFTEEDRKKLFKQFSKLSARPTAGEHSSGLGLSIVKKLVDSLHGTIECESEINNGASMIVKVPV